MALPEGLLGEWKARQGELAAGVVIEPLGELPRFVGGADVAFSRDKRRVIAVALVWDRVEGRVVEAVSAEAAVEVPYIPGYLSFREGPALSAAMDRLTHPFGVMCFDGQGLAHPRRCGLAVHMGVSRGIRSVGVAKSVLVGEHGVLAERAGAWAAMRDRGEVVGAAVRTKKGVRPVYVSVGNRIDLEGAIAVVMETTAGRRIPEPTRWADAEVARVKAAGAGGGTRSADGVA